MKLGSTGPDVERWQRALITRGYSVGVADGVFGTRTHNATCAFQSSWGLEVTGEVALNELQVMSAPGMSSIRPPPMLAHTIPFVPSRFYGAKARVHVELVVLHCMQGPEASTRAERCADYMSTLPISEGMKSAHYYIDSDSVIQGVRDHHIAYGAPGANHNGLHFEHAGYARQNAAEWLDDFGRRMLHLSAQLCARKCQEREIPIRFLRATDLIAPRPRGITTHHEVSLAFGKSDHHDPGPGFPIGWYLAQVRAAMASQEPVA